MNQNENFGNFGKSDEKENYREIIIRSLRKGPKTPAEIISDQKLPDIPKTRTRMDYHFNQLKDDKIIEKKQGAIYHIIITPQKPLDQKILKILESDDFGNKTIKQIKESLDLEDTKNSKNDILESLKKLESEFHIHEFKNMFSIPSWRLNKYNCCVVCRKKFEDDQLIISEITMGDHGGVSNYLMHAVCRNKQQNYVDFDLSNCDYCGLSLNANNLGIKENNKINIDAEIDTLFNEPFSKLFSVINGEHYASVVEVGTAGGYAHFKRKDGKQYHPYCFDIIEKPKKGFRK